jgi:hypothetical protein
VLPVINLKTDSFFNPHLEKNNYFLSKVFTYATSLELLKEVNQKMLEDKEWVPPQDLSLYFLCLFEKKREKKQKQEVKILFKDKWYFINQEDLITL